MAFYKHNYIIFVFLQPYTSGTIIIAPEPSEERCSLPRGCDTIPFSPCLNNGTCVDIFSTGAYNCSCSSDYFGQGCQFFDACSDQPCQNQGSCLVDITSIDQFVCNCREGFTGELCEVQISPCASDPCGNFGSCTERGNDSFDCLCSLGFSGLLCDIDIDECQSDPCQNGGSCVDDAGSFSCWCPPEFSGRVCEEQVLFCSLDACFNGGTCRESGIGFSCDCLVGFEGSQCENDTDECARFSPCNGVCVNLPGSYACVCSPGFTGEDCNTTINFCTNSSCSVNGACQSLSDGFECVCDSGFTGVQCDTIIDDCAPAPCQNDAMCVDGINQFMCICQPGFTGSLCGINIDDCTPSPCAGGSTCVDGPGNFSCLCPPGFSGDLCDIQTDFCLDEPCYNGNCSSTVNGFTCDCFTEWAGDRCQYATSVAVKLESCGLPSAVDILSLEELAMSNEPISFTPTSEVVFETYAISSSTDGIYWSGWVWQDEGTVATLFSLANPSNTVAAEVVSDLPDQQLSLYYTTEDNIGAPISVTFNNVPTRGNQWYHVSIAIFNSNKIVIALDTTFVQERTLPENSEATFTFEIPSSFTLILGQRSNLIQVDSSTFTGIMRGVSVAGIMDEASFNISNIVSCALNCIGDGGFCGEYGFCLDQFGFDRQCKCAYGFTGLQCQYVHSRYSFDGNGLAQLEDPVLISDQTLEFKTDGTEGVIMSRTFQTVEFSIGLRNETVELNFDYCDSTQQSHRPMETSSPLNDLQWHTLSVRDSILLVNNRPEDIPALLQPSCNQSEQGRIILGLSFEGCLRDLELAGQLVDPTSVQLQGSAQFGCTRDTAQFFSVSYVQLPEFISRESQIISFDFSTRAQAGIIYFSNRNPSDATGNSTTDFVSVYIESGQVVFSFNLGEEGQDIILRSSLVVSDGFWHSVEAIQNMTMASLSVDGVVVQDTSMGPLTLLDTTASVFLGGVPLASRPFEFTSLYGFNGCLRDLEQNGVAVDLQANTDSQNVHFGTCN